MTTNRLPKYWIVKSDSSKLFFDTVIKYMNQMDNPQISAWYGTAYSYYGQDGSPVNHGFRGSDSISNLNNCPTLLTLQQFIEMTTEQPWIPQRGEKVAVRDFNRETWSERIFLAHIPGLALPYVTVGQSSEASFRLGETFSHDMWKYMKKFEDKLNISITLNGKEISPSEISEETWNNLRKQ